jgi:hypothetical protein
MNKNLTDYTSEELQDALEIVLLKETDTLELGLGY